MKMMTYRMNGVKEWYLRIPFLHECKRKIGLLLLLFFSFCASYAQQRVTGRVSAGDTALANVTVTVKGKAIATQTDNAGMFSISADPGATLVFTSVGFVPQEIKIGATAVANVQLQQSVQQSTAEVVVVGYGTQKRSDITGSVSSVPKSRLSQLPVTNVLQAIQGSVAGVNITQTSSVPGSSANALVRGVNSISAGTGPYVILDGIPYSGNGGSINDINTNDIASIEILKDASAVAIYGTRGANGVILITTKRGNTGKATIRYNVYGGLEGMAHVLEPGSPEQYVQKYADWKAQSGVVNSDVVPTASERANYAAGKTTNWLDEISQRGYIQDHNLSISGGTKDVRYFVSGEYLKQQGVLKGYQYRRASIRSNLDINLTDYLTVGTNLFFADNNYDGGRVDLNLASQISPYGQLYNANGTYTIFPMNSEQLYTSPLLGLYNDRVERSRNLNGSVYAELKPTFLKGLKYRVNASYNFVPGRSGNYAGRTANALLGNASVNNSETTYWIIENILTYNKDWGRQHIDATALYSAQETNYTASGATATGFINDLLSNNNLGAGATQTSSSGRTKSNLLSQMLRLNYSYDSRYLLTLTARRDGSSVFGANTSKYGLFPSVGFGWNISNEKFMTNSRFINNLKFRGSYGLTGNQAINAYQTITTSANNRLPYNGVSTIGVVANVLGNNDLIWESTYGLNLGLDFSLLKNRIGGTVEVYHTKTKDLLLLRALPIITGYNQIFDNLGKTDNKGLEVTFRTVNIETRDFRWESNINYAKNTNKIVDLYGDKKDDLGNRRFIGKPINVLYDYKLIGVWQAGEDFSIDPGVKAGDLKFADVNGDKKITADDRTILGQTVPKWIGGLTNTFHYKNLNLNIFIQTAQGITRNNANLTNADQAAIINIPAEITYWTAANPSNTRPAIAYKNPRGYGYASDASYTRLKDITLSFVLPQKMLEKIKLSGLTVYASGRNLYTWTDWIGWDPENNYDRGTGANFNNYPLVRSVVVGANISLR